MKKKVIVYGLGENFKADFDAIHQQYDVAGYCDRDEEKLSSVNGTKITRHQLKDVMDKCDFLLLAMSDNRMDAAQDLVVNFAVPSEKIWFFRHTGEAEENDLIRSGMAFYGQFSDDAILLLLIRCLNYNAKNIHYLEIGTNDPILSNNTFFFYSLGASGVIIDPLPLVESFAKRMRPRDRFIRAAVSSIGTPTQTFLMSPATQGSSFYNDYTGGMATKITVPVLGINDVFEDIGFTPELFVVDAEGEDEKIVTGIDFARYRPVIMEVEVNKTEQDGKRLTEFLQSSDYVFFTRIGSNAIYVDKASWENANFDSVNHFFTHI